MLILVFEWWIIALTSLLYINLRLFIHFMGVIQQKEQDIQPIKYFFKMKYNKNHKTQNPQIN